MLAYILQANFADWKIADGENICKKRILTHAFLKGIPY